MLSEQHHHGRSRIEGEQCGDPAHASGDGIAAFIGGPITLLLTIKHKPTSYCLADVGLCTGKHRELLSCIRRHEVDGGQTRDGYGDEGTMWTMSRVFIAVVKGDDGCSRWRGQGGSWGS